MKFSRRIRTVLYGDQSFTDAELDLLHTPALQRLYDLHQLGLTDRVFVDASHTRFSHVIGAMHVTDRIVTAICKNLRGGMQRRLVLKYQSAGIEKSISGTDLADEVETRHATIRLIALLHDLTHAPYGHTLEDEIELVNEKHDAPARQAEAFWRLMVQYLGWHALESFPTEADLKQKLTQKSAAQFDSLIKMLRAPHLETFRHGEEDFIICLAEIAALSLRAYP